MATSYNVKSEPTVEEKIDTFFPMARDTLRQSMEKEGYACVDERTNLFHSFFGNLDDESKRRYLSFISYARTHPEESNFSKPLDPLCSSKFLRKETADFINGLDGDSQYLYYTAVINTGSPDLLTRKDVSGFISRLDSEHRELYLSLLSHSDNAVLHRRLTNERITEDVRVSQFMNVLPVPLELDYFAVIAQVDTDEFIAACVNEKVLGGSGFIESVCTGEDHREVFFESIGILILGMENAAKENAREFDSAHRRPYRGYDSSETELEQYKSVVNDHLRDEYGLRVPLALEQIRVLVDSASSGKKPAPILDLVNSSRDREHVVSYTLTAPQDRKEYSKDQLVRFAMMAATANPSDHGVMTGEAGIMAKFIGQKAVNRANNEFYHSDRNVKAHVLELTRQSDFHEAYLTLQAYADNNEGDISHLLDSVSRIDKSRVDRSMVAFESRNPLDYNSETQDACVFLPTGNRSESGIMKYVTEKDVHLLNFAVDGVPSGTAITFVSDKTLVVDSMEGGWIVRNDAALTLMNDYVLHRASALGADRVLYFTNSPNDTCKHFIKMLRTSNFGTESQIDVDRPGESYLEARRGATAIEYLLPKSSAR
jgi:hypothetical protein